MPSECRIPIVAGVIERHGSISHINTDTTVKWIIVVPVHIGIERIVIAASEPRAVKASDPGRIGIVVNISIIVGNVNIALVICYLLQVIIGLIAILLVILVGLIVLVIRQVIIRSGCFLWYFHDFGFSIGNCVACRPDDLRCVIDIIDVAGCMVAC